MHVVRLRHQPLTARRSPAESHSGPRGAACDGRRPRAGQPGACVLPMQLPAAEPEPQRAPAPAPAQSRLVNVCRRQRVTPDPKRMPSAGWAHLDLAAGPRDEGTLFEHHVGAIAELVHGVFLHALSIGHRPAVLNRSSELGPRLRWTPPVSGAAQTPASRAATGRAARPIGVWQVGLHLTRQSFMAHTHHLVCGLCCRYTTPEVARL